MNKEQTVERLDSYAIGAKLDIGNKTFQRVPGSNRWGGYWEEAVSGNRTTSSALAEIVIDRRIELPPVRNEAVAAQLTGGPASLAGPKKGKPGRKAGGAAKPLSERLIEQISTGLKAVEASNEQLRTRLARGEAEAKSLAGMLAQLEAAREQ